MQKNIASEKIILSDCYSQNKDELVLEFNIANIAFYWRISCSPEFQYIVPEKGLKRAHQNSITLFEDILQQPIQEIIVPNNDRCILFLFDNQVVLQIKMYGNRSNILLFEAGQVIDCFRKKLSSDWESQLPDSRPSPTVIYDKQLKQEAAFLISQGKLPEEVNNYLINSCLNGSVCLVKQSGGIQFWLVKPTSVSGEIREFTDFQTGLIAFVRENYRLRRFSTLFTQTNSTLIGEKKWLEHKIQDSENQVQLMSDCSYELFGNLILAHLPEIQPKQKSLCVWNFEHTQEVEISLKPELAAVANAQRYFQKNKRQRIQLEYINQQTDKYFGRLCEVDAALDELNSCTTLSLLKDYRERFQNLFREKKQVEDTEILPYRKYEYAGYTIWVGKNATANDKMTVQYARKDDLWLHARDVSGSHTIIKKKSGSQFPNFVIEYAAGLAAYFSKAKNATLVSVSFTPKKYVRKHKRHLPGQVTLDREEVILVPPLRPEKEML